MTHDKIQVTNGVAMPNCPIERPKESDFYKRTAHDMNLGDYTLKQISEFNQWAKTQAIPAPGVPGKIYSVDELEIQWQFARWKNGVEWHPVQKYVYSFYNNDFNKAQEGSLPIRLRKVYILKSPLPPTGSSEVVTEIGGEKPILKRDDIQGYCRQLESDNGKIRSYANELEGKLTWVSVKDHLPEPNVRVRAIRTYGNGRQEEIHTVYVERIETFDDLLCDIITHWQYIILPPKF